MIIAPISAVATPVTTTSVQSTLAVNHVSNDAVLPISSNKLSELEEIRGTSVLVDVSTLGQLLDSTARLQSRQAAQTASAAQTTNATNITAKADVSQTAADIEQITAIATLFVDTFNQLQESNSNLTENPLIPTSNDSLLQALNAARPNAAEASLFAQLSKIGINLQRAPTPGSDSSLTLDVIEFQSALAQNPGETLTLLTQALQALGNAENDVLAQNQDLASGNIAASLSADQATDTIAPASVNSNVTRTSETTTSENPANVNNNSVLPVEVDDQVPADADVQLQQMLTNEALQSAISSTANITNNAIQAAKASPAVQTETATSTQAGATNSATANDEPAATVTATNTQVNTSESLLNADTTLADNLLNNISTPASLLNTQATIAGEPNTASSVQENVFTQNQTNPTLNTNVVAGSSLPANESDTTAQVQIANSANQLTPSNAQLSKAATLNQSSTANTNRSTTSEAALTKTQAALNNSNKPTEATNTQNQPAPSAIVNNTNGILINNPLATTGSPEATQRVTTNNPVAQPRPVVLENEVRVNNAPVPATNAQANVNPLISAAVAAYRLRDSLPQTPAEKPRQAQADAVTPPEAVAAVEPVELDLHDQTNHRQHDAEADLAYRQAKGLGQAGKNIGATDNVDAKV
ncbi:hypothetical protein [Undibacterium umbellatum]|uniref:Flagellar hook-length control protein FliK n=1 Tax=Undibacterium umbellatum TaxID=2762300 RepID=A0ABR6Z8K2_9BURK|nr:hypothetical protein [Undibacterium umbellatum]MBC3907502.1 hypothetical protein [Undibacterium umbellatum]